MSTLKRIPSWIAGAIVRLGVALYFWVGGLAKDDGGSGRPTCGAYTAWTSPIWYSPHR